MALFCYEGRGKIFVFVTEVCRFRGEYGTGTSRAAAMPSKTPKYTVDLGNSVL